MYMSYGFANNFSNFQPSTASSGWVAIVPGPRPKIGPSRHIEGNLLSNIPNESYRPADCRTASNFFGPRVESGVKGAYTYETP